MSKNIKVRDDSTNYTATVIKLPPMQTVPGLDKLVQVDVFGNNCLVGRDSRADVLYLFFPAGTQLSHDFCSANYLYRDVALNAPTTTEQKGYLEPNRKIKGLKLKGIVSNGFVIPITSLECMLPYSKGGDISGLEAGDEFTDWCGVEVCRKYISPNQTQATVKGDKQAKINNKLSHLLIPTQFRFHNETTHLGKNLHNINPTDSIVITSKAHGSSCILAYVYVNNKLNWLQKAINKLKWLPTYPLRKLAYIYSSGKPKSNLPKGIDSHWINNGPDFYTSNIWKDTYTKYKHCLEEGISLYGEIVGFTAGGAYVQSPYDYMCEPGTSRFLIYKITYTKPNGEFIVFSWQQLKDYCAKYQLEHVKEFYFGKAQPMGEEYDFKLSQNPTEDELVQWRDKLFYTLQNSYNLESFCKECNNKVPAEGIVLWKDGALNKYEVYKLKSKLFTLKETNSDEVNTEDQQ